MATSSRRASERARDALRPVPIGRASHPLHGYHSGAVRTKLRTASEAAALDPAFARNVEALKRVQPEDLPPSAITARLGAP